MTISSDMQVRTPARKYVNGEHVGPGPWLDVIHECNRICPGMFEAPTSTGPWWAGGSVEEYPTARVLHRDDDPPSVSIIPLTEAAAEILSQAWLIVKEHT